MNNQSLLSSAFAKALRLSWIVFLVPGTICAAQQAAPSYVSHGLPVQAVQAKPLQVVRPMDGRYRQPSGVPWIGDTGEGGLPWARSNTQPAFFSTRPSTQAMQPLAADDRSGSNTLRVSGWWNIDVINPDGSTAEHREFENDFANTNIIVFLLAGKIVPGEPAIFVGSDVGDFTTSPCNGTNGCLIAQLPNGSWMSSTQCTQNPGGCASNLTESFVTVSIQYSPDGPNGPQDDQVPALELSGQITAQNNNPVEQVSTGWLVCSESAATNTSAVTGLNPASCLTNPQNGNANVGLYTLTGYDFPSAIPVTAGQVIRVKIDISFSRYPLED